MRCVRTAPISVEDYIRKRMLKANRPQVENKLNELIDHCTVINQHEHLNNLEIEGKEITWDK